MRNFKFISKTIFIYFLLVGLYSCNSGSEIEEQTLLSSEVETPNEIIKTFEVWTSDRKVGAKIHVMNKEYEMVTEDDIKIKYTEGMTKEMMSGHNVEEKGKTDDKEAIDFHVEFIKAPEGQVSSITFDFDGIRSKGSRGISPTNFTFDGRFGTCGAGGTRVRGFQGFPLNCNHTHWDLEKKTSTSNLFWQGLYEATSNNDLTFIGWVDLLADFPKWKLRIDPDNDCNSNSSFNVILSGC